MIYRLLGAKPSPEQMLTYWKLEPRFGWGVGHLNENVKLFFKKMHLKISSSKLRSFWSNINVLPHRMWRRDIYYRLQIWAEFLYIMPVFLVLISFLYFRMAYGETCGIYRAQSHRSNLIERLSHIKVRTRLHCTIQARSSVDPFSKLRVDPS